MSKQLFNKKEISDILKKASEIQTQKDLYGDKDELTKKELLGLAKEFGIDQDSLSKAIAQKDFPKLDNKFNWLKGTSAIHDIQLIEGEITNDNWEEVEREVRRSLHAIGESNKQGTSFEWQQHFKDIGFRHISFTPENGYTRVEYVHKWPGIKFISGFTCAMIFFAITFLSLEHSELSKGLSVLLSLFAGGIGSYINRFILNNYLRRKMQTMHRVMNTIKDKLERIHSPDITLEEVDTYNSDEEIVEVRIKPTFKSL